MWVYYTRAIIEVLLVSKFNKRVFTNTSHWIPIYETCYIFSSRYSWTVLGLIPNSLSVNRNIYTGFLIVNSIKKNMLRERGFWAKTDTSTETYYISCVNIYYRYLENEYIKPLRKSPKIQILGLFL